MVNNENDELSSNEQVMPGEQAVTTETEVRENGPDGSKYYDWIPFDVPPVKDHLDHHSLVNDDRTIDVVKQRAMSFRRDCYWFRMSLKPTNKQWSQKTLINGSRQ